MMFALPLISPEKKWKTLLWGLLFFGATYFTASLLGQDRAVLISFDYIDQKIPFINWTIWFYISQYIIIPWSFYFVKDPENYSPMFYSMIMAIGISGLIFFLYPTTIHRPEQVNGDLIEGIRWILYQLDAPTNCFPSLHVALACLCSIYIMREHKWIGLFSWLWSFLIIISTMTLKQHYFVDVIGGAVTAFLTCQLADRLLEKEVQVQLWP